MLKGLVKTDIDAITFQIPGHEFYKKNKLYGGPLSKEFYKKAIPLAHRYNKSIGFAIADISMIPFLDSNGADFWKTLSGDISNDILQNELQKTKKTVFISTGFSGEAEIIKVSRKFKNIRFIHTQISQNIEDVNLSAIKRIKAITGKDTAFGLHCANYRVIYLSIAFEPSDIFFYVKENTRERYPDDKNAILISETDELIKNLNSLKKALGDGTKRRHGG